MNNLMLPLLDRLAALSQSALDSANQRSWMQVEKMEREQISAETPPRPNASGNASVIGATDLQKRGPESYPSTSELSGSASEALSVDDDISSDIDMPARSRDEALAVPSIDEEARFLDTSSAPDGRATAPSAAAQATSGQALAASISNSLASAGPLAAAQKLHEMLRPLSAQESAPFFEACHALITEIFVEIQRNIETRGQQGAEEKMPAVQTALVLARLAAAVDKDPSNSYVRRVMQDISAAVLASPTQNDKAIFSGLAQAIGVGAGSKLVLAIAHELVYRNDDQSRARAFLTLILSGFVRLGERIDEAYVEVIRHLQLLLIESAGWRSLPNDKAIQAMIVFVKREPILLENLEPRLDRLEQVGLEAFRAVRDLAAFSFDPELRVIHSRFVSSSSVLSAIATSRAALRELRQAAPDGGPSTTTLEATRLMLTHIGFDAPRAAFLADLSQIGGNMMMSGNWTALESFELMEAQGRTFQRLLAFLNGQYVVTAMPEIVSFDDSDMQL